MKTICPCCGKDPGTWPVATPTRVVRETPTPGDLSFCFDCGRVLVFLDDLTLRESTPAELEALDVQTRDEFSAMQRLVAQRGFMPFLGTH